MCFPSVLVSSVAITTYYRLVAQTALISHSLEAGNLRSVGLCSGEGPLPGLSMVAFLLCSHMSEKQREKEQETALGSSFYKATSPMRLMPHPYDLI